MKIPVSTATCLTLPALLLAGCHHHPAAMSDVASPAQAMVEAVLGPEPTRSVQIVATSEPLPLPQQQPLSGQMKRLDSAKVARESAAPLDRVLRANDAARVQPSRDGFINAVQVYPWSDGALYQVYAAPGQISDIILQEGETLIGNGPVAAGDTVRWIIGDTVSGTGGGARVHILVKPMAATLATNMIINTNRRTYHLELHATPKAYMASVSWTYPANQLLALGIRGAEAERTAPVASGLQLNQLNFGYRIEGDNPVWRPLRAFDDGTHVYIAFPDSIAQSEMPPLFVAGASGKAELVNYRIRQNHMIVDRLFGVAELRLGAKHQQVVRIIRTTAKR